VDAVEVDGVEAFCPYVMTNVVESAQKVITQRESLQEETILGLIFISLAGYSSGAK